VGRKRVNKKASKAKKEKKRLVKSNHDPRKQLKTIADLQRMGKKEGISLKIQMRGKKQNSHW